MVKCKYCKKEITIECPHCGKRIKHLNANNQKYHKECYKLLQKKNSPRYNHNWYANLSEDKKKERREKEKARYLKNKGERNENP